MARIAIVAGRENWHVVWTENGGTRRKSTGSADRVDAEAFLQDFILKRSLDKPARFTIGDLLDRYIEERRELIAAPEALEYRAKALKISFPYTLARHINADCCRSHINRRREKEISDATVRSELSLLSAALRYAVGEGWLEKLPRIILPPAPPPKDRWLHLGEAKKLLRACRAQHLRLFVIIALYSAARSGAILELTWDRVDFKHRIIDFNVPNRRRTSKRRAVVPINDSLFSALKRAKKRAATEWVIEWGGKPVKSIKKAFRGACATAELPGVSAHTLRHTAATWMAQEGTNMWEISGVLGHSDSRTTEKNYTKHSPDYLVDAVRALDKKIERRVRLKRRDKNHPGPHGLAS